MKSLLLTVVMALALSSACSKKAITAPVPGTINTFDAYSARVIGDAQEAILSAKAWEMCSDSASAPFVTVDGSTRPCDVTAPKFPAAGRPYLFQAEEAYNVALAAAQTYHAGASSDTTGLAQGLTQLSLAIGNLLSNIGKAH